MPVNITIPCEEREKVDPNYYNVRALSTAAAQIQPEICVVLGWRRTDYLSEPLTHLFLLHDPHEPARGLKFRTRP